jgi:putative transposase
MPDYRRAFVPGGCWFFTVNLLERRNTLLVNRIDALRDAMERAVTRLAAMIGAPQYAALLRPTSYEHFPF